MALTLRKIVSSPALHVALVLVAGTWVLLAALDAAGGLAAVHGRLGWWGLGIVVPVQAAVAVTPFPSEVVALANSAVFGFWLGFVANWSAWMLMALVQHPLARRAAVDLDFETGLARLPGWLRRLPVGHPAYLIFARYLPYGNHLVNLSAGAFGVPLGRLLWCTALREIPVALFFAAAGVGLIRWWE